MENFTHKFHKKKAKNTKQFHCNFKEDIVTCLNVQIRITNVSLKARDIIPLFFSE